MNVDSFARWTRINFFQIFHFVEDDVHKMLTCQVHLGTKVNFGPRDGWEYEIDIFAISIMIDFDYMLLMTKYRQANSN